MEMTDTLITELCLIREENEILKQQITELCFIKHDYAVLKLETKFFCASIEKFKSENNVFQLVLDSIKESESFKTIKKLSQ